MAPKKSVSEGLRKKLKSRAQRDESPSMDNTFRSSDHLVRFHDDISHRTVVFGKIVNFPYLQIITFILESFFKLKVEKTSFHCVKFNTPLLLNTFTHTLNTRITQSLHM